jgi:hypothetical protein
MMRSVKATVKVERETQPELGFTDSENVREDAANSSEQRQQRTLAEIVSESGPAKQIREQEKSSGITDSVVVMREHV